MRFLLITYLVFSISGQSLAIPHENHQEASVWGSLSSVSRRASSWCLGLWRHIDPFYHLHYFLYQQPLHGVRVLTHDVTREFVAGALQGASESIGCAPVAEGQPEAQAVDRMVAQVVVSAVEGVSRGLRQTYARPVLCVATFLGVIPVVCLLKKMTRKPAVCPTHGVLSHILPSSFSWFHRAWNKRLLHQYSFFGAFDLHEEDGFYVSRSEFADFYQKACSQNFVEWVFVSEDFVRSQPLIQRYLFLRSLDETFRARSQPVALVFVGSCDAPSSFMNVVDLSFFSSSVSKFYIPMSQ